ncbi:hypothetical protein BDV32DRAFT_119447 [Aspergillus pseudonomiae]|nr:hypothetical protein BDV32DRAFT_119447 [Aspergillus pseudonomiae]
MLAYFSISSLHSCTCLLGLVLVGLYACISADMVLFYFCRRCPWLSLLIYDQFGKKQR